MFKPEVLAPAGNLEKLKVAVLYGADAVYLGGQKYGLRARADNFTDTELKRGVDFAHSHNAKVYVTLNAYLHDEDLDGLEEYCQFLDSINVDAVIVSDLGVIRHIARSSKLPIHLSTQASCLNSQSAKVWKSLGVDRIVVGRELSIRETGTIKRKADVEVEMFVHGALCMAFSGSCTISNFTAGRDSNRGGCIQSCRYHYKQTAANTLAVLPDNTTSSSFMSSKDLNGIQFIEDYFKWNITSLKIEGRMKSAFHAATTCKTYRKLIDAHASGETSEELVQSALRELETLPNRDHFPGSLAEPAGTDSVFQQAPLGTPDNSHLFLGTVLDKTDNKFVIRLNSNLNLGDTIELMPFKGENIEHRVESFHSVQGDSLSEARQESIICLAARPEFEGIDRLNLVRIKNLEERH